MAGTVDTLVFLDVDGVLNFGLKDGNRAALFLNESNVRWAAGFQEKTLRRGHFHDMASKLSSAAQRYTDAVCTGSQQSSDTLVRRLAHILQSVGRRPSVILSSSWRKPANADRVLSLEREISKHMGEKFEFDGRTELEPEVGAADRLRLIGKYMQKRCRTLDAEKARPLRVLILEDFFVSALDGWACDGMRMRSAQDVEAYVEQCVPEYLDVKIKLVHCYTEWVTPQGVSAQAGVGLSRRDVEEARAFFQGVVPIQPLATGVVAERKQLDTASVQAQVARKLSAKVHTLEPKQAETSMLICWTGILSLAPFVCIHF
mmetsp:Transcript_109362/g.316101  ORF Transcript_109362/g.316101 Transcript_109362/m.316101 type:complete len:316 (-) Transcript_109362:240-1187(-)